MKKIILQAITLAILFFSIWFALRQVPWMNYFKIADRTQQLENKLGDLFWQTYKSTQVSKDSGASYRALELITDRLCKANHIDRNTIKIHLLINPEVNAFALPDGHLVVNSGLLEASQNAEEVAGVVAHELVHITHQHVMNKMIKEVGLSVLISMSSVGNQSEAIRKLLQTLSSSSFDRSLEKEADLIAVDYLAKAQINPKPLGAFLIRITEKAKNGEATLLEWISTHPDAHERAGYIQKKAKKIPSNWKVIYSAEEWEDIIHS